MTVATPQARPPSAAAAQRVRLTALNARLRRVLAALLILVFVVVPLVWVLFLAPTTGTAATTFGSAVHDPKDFLITLLNGITAAGLYFVVASGFTLIFGLMRVVNMAHGAFFLLGGYIALKLQRQLVGQGGAFGLTSEQVTLLHWVVPVLVGTVIVAAIGLLMQQLFLRWNQGQDLRQALITIAISIILADLMLPGYKGIGGGIAQDIAWPKTFDKFLNLHVAGIQYTLTRLVILAIATGIGVLLWLWLKRTRTGMVIRAGVDDRSMVSALGINIQLTFAIAFFVGSGLAGLGGAIGGSFGGLAPGVDANWLLYSLVVVIIGGMGSLGGAAVGALLLGLTVNFSAAYLPSNYTYYSIIFTFALVAVVLAVKPLGLFGRPA
jgi:branched-chain amino acid transport system permease protein